MLILAMLSSLCFAEVAVAGPIALPGEGAAPPVAQATLAPDGQYDLVLQPPRGWEEAEITVGGGEAHDVGAVDLDEPLRLEGVTSAKGELSVTVQAVDGSDHGITWIFTVVPELVPLGSPRSERLEADGKRGFFSIFGGRGSEG